MVGSAVAIVVMHSYLFAAALHECIQLLCIHMAVPSHFQHIAAPKQRSLAMHVYLLTHVNMTADMHTALVVMSSTASPCAKAILEMLRRAQADQPAGSHDA